MAIKNFIMNNTYSRIERVYVNKAEKRTEFYLTVYKDNTCEEKLIQELTYSIENVVQHHKCTCENGFILTPTEVTDEQGVTEIVNQNVTCEICDGTGYIAQNDFTDIIEPALKIDQNIIAVCYNELMKKPEFDNTEAC